MSHFTLPDGTRLHFDDRGHGKVLLCLPGLTRTTEDFSYVLPHLRGRVIRMDYRGRGGSSWTGGATYTVPQEAQDVLALMDHLNVTQFAVLGTSRGGLVGMLLAALAPERVTGLCLNDIGPVIERAGLERIATYVGRAPSARDHASFAAALKRYALGFADVPDSRWLEEARKHARIGPAGLENTYDPALREGVSASLAGPLAEAWPLFEACARIPVAVIRGANSDLLSRDTVAGMARRHPGLIVAEVPGRGHVPFLDEPESLAAIAAFQEAT